MRLAGRVSTILGFLRRSENADPSQFGGFQPKDKIKQVSEPKASGSLLSQAEDRTRSSPTNGPQFKHQNATFALISDDRQPSITDLDCESSSVGGGNRRPSQARDESRNVREYRNIEQQAGLKSGSGRSRRQTKSVLEPSPQYKRKRSLISQAGNPSELAHDRIDDDDDELAKGVDDYRKFRRVKRKTGTVDLTTDLSPNGKRPQHNQITPSVIDFTINDDESRSKRMRKREDDELSSEEPQRATKKARLPVKNLSPYPTSQTLVSRADIKPATFSSCGASNKALLSPGCLLVRKAFRGPYHVCLDEQLLQLETSASGPVFYPYERGSKEKSPHFDWLVVNFGQLYKVCWNKQSLDVILDQRGGTSIGGKPLNPSLFLRFSTLEAVGTFIEYLKTRLGSKMDVKFEGSNLDALCKIFDHQFLEIRQAKGTKIQRDHSNAEDVQLLEHNQKRRGVPNGLEPRNESARSQQAARRPKLIDGLMGQSKPVVVDSENEKRANELSVQPKQRALRSRQAPRNTFDLTQSFERISRSPSPKPKAKPWTEENPGWDREWRVDLSQFRTTIHKGDIGRLEEGELLNDSIISFYLQHLHEAVRNKDANTARRFYFQSSFFWDRLKSTTNKKGINYDKVKSWTNRVDLFSYDYIVVPVNENSHWYVAVICHPGKLLPKDDTLALQASPPNCCPQYEACASAGEHGLCESGFIMNDVSRKSPESLPATASSHFSPGTEMSNNLGRLSLGKAVQETADDVTAISIDDDDDICLITSDVQPRGKPTKTNEQGSEIKDREIGKGSVKSKESPVYSGKDPCIITFDSLGSSHSPVCTALKKYLEHEAKHRKGLDIEMPNMGRTAKNIPLQDNYWDCGVFLMSYVEALMRNPEDFIRKVLPKKVGAADEGLACTVDAVAMRRLIRNTILEQQIIYQKKVEEEAEAKRLRKLRKVQGSASAGVATIIAKATQGSGPISFSVFKCSATKTVVSPQMLSWEPRNGTKIAPLGYSLRARLSVSKVRIKVQGSTQFKQSYGAL